MSTLKLSLHKEYLGSEITHGVVARVQHFARAGQSSDGNPTESLPAPFHDVVIPAGRDATTSLVVEPGHHRIQVFLPSGQVLQEDR